MTEMLGLSAMAEVPTVIVNVQRGGPSTGNPTKGEQSDLFQALYGTHGDAPRVVLACGDVEDCFHATVEAFNISEEYQLPVLVLSDQAVGQRKETLPASRLQHEVRDRARPSEAELVNYQRYVDTPNGVSPMSVPGTKNGMYQTNGLEHDASGGPSSAYLTHEKMNTKRYRKMWPIRDRYHTFRRYGPEEAEVGIVCWGASDGPVQEAVLAANERGEKVSAFVPQILYPFPKRAFQQFLGELQGPSRHRALLHGAVLQVPADLSESPRGRTHVFKRSGGKNLGVAEVTREIRKVQTISSARKEEVA